jgi:hypothetical protein
MGLDTNTTQVQFVKYDFVCTNNYVLFSQSKRKILSQNKLGGAILCILIRIVLVWFDFKTIIFGRSSSNEPTDSVVFLKADFNLSI